NGSGLLQLEGIHANTFTGTLENLGGVVVLNKPYGTNACAGPIQVGPIFYHNAPAVTKWLNSYQDLYAPLTVYAGAMADLNGNNEEFGPVDLYGGRVETGTGQFGVYQPVTVHSEYGEAIINGVLGLPPVYPNNPFVVNHAGAGALPDLLINANIIGTGA